MSILLDTAEKWLNDLGIDSRRIDHDTLLVSRNGMMVFSTDSDAEKAYAEVLNALKEALNTKRLMWAGKDDEWLILGAY